VTTPFEAQDRLRRVAAAVVEGSEGEAVSRFLEKLSVRDDGQELRDALVVEGARALIRAAVVGEQQQDRHAAREVAGIVRRLA
jgi:hypothetical protein